MPLKISWTEPKNRGLLILILGIAAITQLTINFIASYQYLINSIFVSLFLTLGVVSLLFGAEIFFAELVHTLLVHSRQNQPAKKKKRLKKISESFSILVGAGISIGFFILIYLIFAYFLIDPFSLTNIPIYSKFVLAEVLSGIVVIIILLVFESAVPKK